MLSYDAVLCTQERLYSGELLTEAANDVVKQKLTPATIIEKAQRIVESLLQLMGKAVQQFGTFLRTLIDEGRKEVGAVAKKLDKAKDITGMQVMGYTFGGLNNQVAAKYKSANLDKFLEAMRIPKIETMDDLHRFMKNPSDVLTFVKESEMAATRSKLIEYMTGIKIGGNDPKAMTDELMLRLWGSKDPIVLTANKEFTLGGAFQDLVSPPLAKSVLMSYKSISKKLYSVKKLLPFMAKGGTAVGKAAKVERRTEQGLAHSDEYVKKYKLTKEQAENMDKDLQKEIEFVRYYIVFLKSLSRDINEINRCLITTVAAQHRQSKFIIRKAITFKTVDKVSEKQIKKNRKVDEADRMNARAREYTETDERRDTSENSRLRDGT